MTKKNTRNTKAVQPDPDDTAPSAHAHTDADLSGLDRPSCEELAPISAALYPCFSGTGRKRAKAAAKAALQLWEETSMALIERRQNSLVSSGTTESALHEVGRQDAYKDDPADGTTFPTASKYLRKVFRHEGQKQGQNNDVLMGYLKNCVRRGYKRRSGTSIDDATQAVWNSLESKAAAGGIAWNSWEVLVMRSWFLPKQRSPRKKGDDAPEAAVAAAKTKLKPATSGARSQHPKAKARAPKKVSAKKNAPKRK